MKKELNKTKILYNSLLSLASSSGFFIASLITFLSAFKNNSYKLEYTKTFMGYSLDITWLLCITVSLGVLFIVAIHLFIKAFINDKENLKQIFKDKYFRIFLMFLFSLIICFAPLYIVSTIFSFFI